MRAYMITGLAGALLVLLLDSEAVFSLLSYIPLYIVVLCYGAVGFRWGLSEIRRATGSRLAGTGALVAALAVVVLGFALPYLRTSARKGFHVDAASLRPGMKVELIRKIMGRYRIEESDDYVAFTFRDSVNTADRVIVDLTSDYRARKIEIVTD